MLVVGSDLGSSMQVESLRLTAQLALGDGTVVGVEHDADGLALVDGASRWGAGGGGGQEPGEERIFLAHGFVGDDGYFAVARRGDEGDDTTALEKSQDALARPLHEPFDIFLAGRDRGVKHLALAVSPFGDFGTTPAPAHPASCARALAVGRVHAVEKSRVKVRVEPEVAVGALNDRHGT